MGIILSSRRLPLVACLLLVVACASPWPRAPAGADVLGAGEHLYVWDAGWLQPADGAEHPGPTHGEIVVASDGTLVISSDTERAICRYAPDGSFLGSWGAEFANGVHGMVLAVEDGRDVLYFAHFNRHEVVKATLDGEILWRRGAPQEPGLYEDPNSFRPTDVAVADGTDVYVADGYGLGWIHRLDRADGRWLASWGGRGSEPGRFATPHGIHVDTRFVDDGVEPTVLVADRENHRLQRFDLDGNLLDIVEGMLRRPCKVQQWGDSLVIPDLAGRVTVLGADDSLVTQLGDQPDEALRAQYAVSPANWEDGVFLSPHSAAWDATGNLYVMDWNQWGRVNRLMRVRAP